MKKFKIGNRVKNKRGQEGSVVEIDKIRLINGQGMIFRYEVKNGTLRFWGFDHTLELVDTNEEEQ